MWTALQSGWSYGAMWILKGLVGSCITWPHPHSVHAGWPSLQQLESIILEHIVSCFWDLTFCRNSAFFCRFCAVQSTLTKCRTDMLPQGYCNLSTFIPLCLFWLTSISNKRTCTNRYQRRENPLSSFEPLCFKPHYVYGCSNGQVTSDVLLQLMVTCAGDAPFVLRLGGSSFWLDILATLLVVGYGVFCVISRLLGMFGNLKSW